MILIIPIIIFVVLTMILPQLMIYTLLAVIGHVLGLALRKQQIGKLVVLLCIFSSLTLLVEKANPLIEKSEDESNEIKKEFIDKQFYIEEEKNDVWSRVWDFITKSKEKEKGD